MPSDPATNPTPASAYDLVAYPSQIHAQTHPERLATIGRLFGLDPAAVTRCRVLELGCGNATNLIPMAWALPQSHFTGIDLAAAPIRQGLELVNHLALENCHLRQGDIRQIDRSWGTFDYIIAHGVYSWVPAEVRDHLLTVCGQCLAPDGIAFISYNVYPGGHLSILLREMMLWHTREIADAGEQTRQALALARLVADAKPAGTTADQSWMCAELERLLSHDPAQVYHDELAANYAPVYFSEFAEHARRHELQFVGEADFPEMSDQPFSPEARQALAQLASDRLRHEQLRDFLKCRRFRQTLLTRAAGRVSTQPQSNRVSGLLITLPAELRADGEQLARGVNTTFTTPAGGRVTTDLTLGKAALHHLIARHPQPVSQADLWTGVRQRLVAANFAREPEEDQTTLNRFLLQLYERNIIHFHTWQPDIPRSAGERPLASPIARWQIERDLTVTTLRHQSVKVQDEIGRLLITTLDGTRSREAIGDVIMAGLQQRGLIKPGQSLETVKEDLVNRLEENLQKLAAMGLLVR